MNRFIKPIIFGLSLFLMGSASVFAAEKGTKDDAIALVKKAAAYLKENGQEKAAAEFNNRKGRFVNHDLYVYAIDIKTGTAWADGDVPRAIGKPMLELKDANGKFFVKEIIKVAEAWNSGWVDYHWPNPVTNTIDAKTTYVEKVGDSVIACGFYK